MAVRPSITPSNIFQEIVEQINQDYAISMRQVSNEYDDVPPVHYEDSLSHESTPSPGRLYIDESREPEECLPSSPIMPPDNVMDLNNNVMYLNLR